MTHDEFEAHCLLLGLRVLDADADADADRRVILQPGDGTIVIGGEMGVARHMDSSGFPAQYGVAYHYDDLLSRVIQYLETYHDPR